MARDIGRDDENPRSDHRPRHDRGGVETGKCRSEVFALGTVRVLLQATRLCGIQDQPVVNSHARRWQNDELRRGPRNSLFQHPASGLARVQGKKNSERLPPRAWRLGHPSVRGTGPQFPFWRNRHCQKARATRMAPRPERRKQLLPARPKRMPPPTVPLKPRLQAPRQAEVSPPFSGRRKRRAGPPRPLSATCASSPPQMEVANWPALIPRLLICWHPSKLSECGGKSARVLTLWTATVRITFAKVRRKGRCRGG